MNQRRHGPRPGFFAVFAKSFASFAVKSFSIRRLRTSREITVADQSASHRLSPGIRYNLAAQSTNERGTMDVNTQIKEIRAREILDSRGNPTVEAEVTLASGTRG